MNTSVSFGSLTTLEKLSDGEMMDRALDLVQHGTTLLREPDCANLDRE